jgi:hypothetical protein
MRRGTSAAATRPELAPYVVEKDKRFLVVVDD